ncbi:MAG: HAMP domain-containing sensor histidine kinase [Beijerinckiaceae bacterium]|nr:HAMP domain-containing sensor histidine kinase [Beijerinckiaceae bacterium]
MTAVFHPQRWPLAIRAPLIVALLMIGIAAAMSKVVLDRLARDQAQSFRQLTGAYLDGLSTALHSPVIRQEPWEAFDVLDRARHKYSGVNPRIVLVILPNDTILAALDPATYPVGVKAPDKAHDNRGDPDLADPGGRVWVHRMLREGGKQIGRIAAEIDISNIQQVRQETFWTLLGVNGALTLLFAGLGWLVVHRTLRPLLRLSSYLARAGDGRLEPIPERKLPPPDTEAGKAYRRYNAAALAISEREALLHRLADQERRALLGRYASAIAHEVNNPLGGLFNAVRMIQRHGDDPERRERAATLLERGLTGIRNIVRASLVVWRGDSDDRNLTSADIDDLRFLIESEAHRRELALVWNNALGEGVRVPAQAFRQLALNLALNACAASPPGTQVVFDVRSDEAAVLLSVSDQGPGLPDEARASLQTPGIRDERATTGLGLWIVSRILEEQSATLAIHGPPGTAITIRIPHAEPGLQRAA